MSATWCTDSSMNKVVTSFAWNHEGLGHVSRLIGIHTVIRQRGLESLFFVEHHQQLIDDYQLPQVVVPSHPHSLVAEDWWIGKSNGMDYPRARNLSASIVRDATRHMDCVIVHDVVVHRSLYDEAVAKGWSQSLVYRDRKDVDDPVAWIQINAPEINVLYWLGKPHIRQQFNDLQVVGVHDVVRPLLGENSIWSPEAMGPDCLRVVITAGGGGHPDAQQFLQNSIDAIAGFSEKCSKAMFLVVVTGPYFRGVIRIPKRFNATATVTPYLNPTLSQYIDTSLLISQGGYNTFNEARQYNQPVVIVPGNRMLDDQVARGMSAAKNSSWIHSIAASGTVLEINNSIESVTGHLPPSDSCPGGQSPNGADEIAEHISGLF